MLSITAENEELFFKIDSAVHKLLKTATEGHSDVLIVTNAHKSWVDYSSEKFLPLTAKLIKQRIKVISARVEPTKSAPCLNQA